MNVVAESTENGMDRLKELAQAAAERAASAFGLFVGNAFEVGAPTLHAADTPASTGGVEPARAVPGGWGAGVFFEVEGDLRGHVAVLFSAPACENMLCILLGKQSEDREDAVVESALREVGNLLASHALSAIADRLGVRALASIPILVLERPAVALESLLAGTDAGPGRVHAESELRDREGAIWSLLVLVPESPGWASG